ncbi:MAG: DUF2800 domain-containing protein [Oscillospiraceae bacterium]|nr:DUF2800 domain-containing protein [Oscillospiraceae bacterium]
MDHHEFSPSRLEMFRICPGAYKMQLGIPDVPSEYAAEGTLLHNAVATGNLDGLNREQISVVDECWEFIESIAPKSDYSRAHEVKMLVRNDLDGGILTIGTADFVAINSRRDDLICVDFKFGYTPVKVVKQNIQLAAYSAGAMQMEKIGSCDAFVFQPRIHARSHHVFTNEKAILANIRSIIKRCNGEPFILNATEESCRYCNARLNCPAFRLKFQRLLACKRDYDPSDIPTLVSLFDASRGVKTLISEIEANVKKVIEETGRCGKYGFQITDGAREIQDLNALYAVVKDYLTPHEFNDVCKVTIGKLENAVADKLIAEANAKGERLSKNSAKQRCYSMIADLITRGSPTKKIVEVA